MQKDNIVKTYSIGWKFIMKLINVWYGKGHVGWKILEKLISVPPRLLDTLEYIVELLWGKFAIFEK